jgi:hypothetical protein
MPVTRVRDIAGAMRPRAVSRAVTRQDKRVQDCLAHGCPVFGDAESPRAVKRFADREIARYLASKAKGR